MKNNAHKKIKVLVIDDSALIRQLLTTILNSVSDIEVVATAPDPIIAREKIKKLNPDVLTLDIEMPKMDGISFLSNIMRLRPMPVVMVSSLTEKGADITLQALELGAVDFVSKPKIDIAEGIEKYSEEIVEKVRIAASANVKGAAPGKLVVHKKYSADAILKSSAPKKHLMTTEKVIAIGASTGGTEAIKTILSALPPYFPGIVIAQHMPETFTKSFAERMDKFSQMTVCEATNGEQIVSGRVYIAPGNQHLIVERSGARYICKLSDGPAVNRHRPSVDVLFRSVSQNVGPNSIGVLLTGMGSDGANGLKEMHDAGARTIIQDENTSVVWGMPREAYKLGAADKIEPVYAIPDRLQKLLYKMDVNKHEIKGCDN